MAGVIEIEAEIQSLAARRSDIWAGRTKGEPGECTRIGQKITALYEERRREQASIRTGGRTHAEIVRIARIESELERLMTR